ncbi:helix-turn-helix domain-containing protein [Mesorhizobium sp. M1004]|uniref:helix-turn-helix domain-containing protein n=1 Tax=Mesorhizobium sp. M1004 TaxID=2957046 RepID=UPI00333CE3FC
MTRRYLIGHSTPANGASFEMNTNTELLVMSVPEAGAKLGLSRNGSYEAAARGDIPTIRIGKLIKVPKAAFERMLARSGEAA